MTTTWDPNQYALFRDERSRPFFELLQRIPDRAYESIFDLGCGTGELTARLADRWPRARVVGLDSSPEMLAQAAALARPGRLDFRRGDIADFGEACDLLFSNAALQWLDDHESLIPRLAGLVRPGGCFAVQMPANFYAESHTLLNDTAREGPWAAKLADGWRPPGSRALPVYIEALWPKGFTVDAWETEYYFVLQGDDPVLEWVKGTALRPVLAMLDEGEAAAFTAAYAAKLRRAYPRTAHGTIFPFKRLFFVATKD
ncbi:MAG TPA: methyltransferase domain-containing protein [Dehalococcoidia bacterium]|nr:methyltransferase domain-containing protein [Dehalococcoidia bacterium]